MIATGSYDDFSYAVRNVGDTIVQLPLLEIPELIKYLEQHSIKCAIAVGTPVLPEEQYTVTLTSYPATQKIPVIKVIRAIQGIGLKEAKDLAEALPAKIATAVDLCTARRLVAELRDAGGIAHYE